MGHGVGTECTMGHSLLLTLLLAYIVSRGKAEVQCPQVTGHPSELTRFSNGLKVGSVAKFLCPPGQYAWPVSSRTCQANGQWSYRNGRVLRSIKISCKDMRCPNPGNFENGEYYPRGPYKVGDNITFVCNDGYIPRGSMERTCKSNAKWSGETAICDDGAGHCPDPGTPPGAQKTGFRYDIDETVSYKCDNGLELLGSAKRTCLENRRWSGTEVSCQYPYAFDLPEEAGQQFAGSLSGLLNTYEKKDAVGRTINIKKDGILNVYLLLDASESVGEENFNIAKKSVEELISRLGSFDMIVQFGVLSYATETNIIINVHDEDSSDVDFVEEQIANKLQYNYHRNKQGTNIKGAFKAVLDMMAFQKIQYKEEWNSTQHVIILLTDGKSNTGGRPVDMIKKIKEFLDIKPNREDHLDIYAFGISEDVDRAELNDIASQKNNEKHIFTLEEVNDINTVFREITKIEKYGEMCGLNDDSSSDEKDHHPWNVLIKAASASPCFGSLISSQWVLTAAHCIKGHPLDQYLFQIGSKSYKVKEIIVHECYNITRKANRGIREDYDYDVALVKLAEKVEFSKTARPICLPCTEMANRAMKKPKTATCNDHREHLLSSVSGIPAGFIAKTGKNNELEELRVQIQHNNAREGCIAAINQWPKFRDLPNFRDMVSPRHLCVEGDMSCKGESGGSLFVDIRDRKRFFQVGILSFGIYNACEKQKKRKEPKARDFYVNVLEVLPFLRQHLEGELQFLPGIPAEEEIVCPS